MKALRKWIVRFIAQAVAEDYQANGITRQVVVSDAATPSDVVRTTRGGTGVYVDGEYKGLLFRIPEAKKEG